MVNDSVAVPEFSRPLPVDKVGGHELVREIEATAAERAALAERLDLIALDGLTASLRLRRLADGLIRVDGRLDAEVVQACVVTLAPVARSCAEAFTMLFGEGAEPEAVHEIEIDGEAEDEPEPVIDGQIDLGEAVVQQLAVSLDPYPRAPGAQVPEALAGGAEAGGDSAENPFAALTKLRPGSGDGG